MPCARSRSVLLSELDTAPAMRLRAPASASMKWLTVEPVPTPTRAPSGTWSSAARPTSAFSSSCVMGSSCGSCSVEVADYRGHNLAMSLVPYALTRPFLFGLDAERAHELTLRSLEALQNTPAQHFWAQPRVDDPVTLAGLRF